MSYIKTLLSNYPKILVKPFKNPNNFVINHPNYKSFSFFYTTHTPNSSFHSSKPQKSTKDENFSSKNKTPLHVIFKKSLGLCEKEETLVNFNENDGENGELVKKLWDLEVEIRELKSKSPSIEENVGNLRDVVGKCGESEGLSLSKSTNLMGVVGKCGENEGVSMSKSSNLRGVVGKWGGNEGVSMSKPSNLAALFGGNVEEEKKEVVFKEMSEEMKELLRCLYEGGYFKDVNFLGGNRFDMSCFYEEYAREYVKFALQRFGNDHKDISMWLSGSDAKSVAVFGCPSVTKGDVFAAKKLRGFFNIKEETVCCKCVLRESCKYANKSAGEGHDATLRLDSLLRLLRAYSLEEISPRLKLTDDMKACVGRLIREVINLSKGVAEAGTNGSGERAISQGS